MSNTYQIHTSTPLTTQGGLSLNQYAVAVDRTCPKDSPITVKMCCWVGYVKSLNPSFLI